MKVKIHSIPLSFIYLPMLYLVIGLGISACKPSVSLSKTPINYLYSDGTRNQQPLFKVYHADQTRSEVHYMFKNIALTYASNPDKSRDEAHVEIKWMLYANFSASEPLDSASFIKIDTITHSGVAQLQGMFELNIPQGSNRILKVITKDLQSGIETLTFIEINKSDPVSDQFFIVKRKENNTLLFRDYFYDDEELIIIYPLAKDSTLTGKHYPTLFPISAPPFSFATSTPFDFDSYTDLSLNIANDTLFFKANTRGIYHFSVGKDQRHSGLTLFQFSRDFPTVDTEMELLNPLRFLSSRKEFELLKKSEQPKQAIDNFWMATNQNIDKSRDLVKYFYNRVEAANYYYTSFKEGWKTDRGIIYIVFGPPTTVYHTPRAEHWSYGEQSPYRSLTFNFNKIKNPFTDNDYVLQRSAIYKNPWYKGVDYWREGKVTGPI